MLPTIATGNVASATASTGYEVANSCRFNDGDNPKLIRTQTAGDQRQGTFSAWIKKSSEIYLYLMSWNTTTSGTAYGDWIRFNDGCLDVIRYTGSVVYRVQTNRLFRDTSAWYHICVAYDSDQATASNRIKIYVNGVQETSLKNSDYPAENLDFNFNDNSIVACVGRNYDTQASFDGYMAEVCWIDGLQLTPSSFGEFDEDSPTIFKPIDVSGLTFGTNGFYLDFEDSSNLGNDANGGTDFTESNLAAIDQTVDTPTNNFCTINPLDYYPTVPSDLEGNTVYNKSSTGDTHNSFANCTMGVTAGKWYYELKVGDGNAFMVGWVKTPHSAPDAAGAYSSDSGLYVVKNAGEKIVAGSESGSAWNTVTTNDIIGLAYDFDNLKFYISKNGTWENSGDPTSGATGTGSFGNIAAGTYVPMIGNANYNATSLHYFNFGNPAYSLSSAVNDANGYGNFEYAVPSGYLALCTKNLGSDGG